MRPPTIFTLALLATAALTLAPVGTNAAQAAPCTAPAPFRCVALSVPLDRGAHVSGSVQLQVQILQERGTPSETAVVALAGGPGQAALPLAGELAGAVSPALAGRDLIVFDQRGTGSSGPLECSALEGEGGLASIGQAFERCALQIGARRGSYTTAESVADIESLRQALGYRKLVLFGVSYGTKVALRYAEAHPQNIEALLLDSVVPPERDDPFQLATFKAMAPAFAQLCSNRACSAITANPLGDIARLTARIQHHALTGYVYDGAGHRRRSSMSGVALLDLIAAGDLNPALRALLPASVTSALRGDSAPLLRLNLLSQGLVPNVPGTPTASAGDGVDEALFVDTTCEEEPFPWNRTAAPATRVGEALSALHSLPASAFYPFSASVEWADGLLTGCAHWPNVAAAPAPVSPLPNVPTLILSGSQDLRTPTSGAQAVAARIPDAQLLVVPFTGHSVLGSDFSGCAQNAVKDFFTAVPVQSCRTGVDPFAPTPVTPTRLAYVKPVGGVHGLPGSTLTVALETILDLERQVVGATLQAEQQLPNGSSFGGLRGGYARITSTALVLHRFSFVPGVQLSGRFPISKGKLRPADLRVEGSLAARGSVRVGGAVVTGTLAGRNIHLELAKVKIASVGAADATASTLALRFPLPGLVGAR